MGELRAEERSSPVFLYEPSTSVCNPASGLALADEVIIVIVVMGVTALIMVVVAVFLYKRRASQSSLEGSDMNPEYGTYNGTGDVVEVEDRNTEDYGDTGFEPKVVDNNIYYEST